MGLTSGIKRHLIRVYPGDTIFASEVGWRCCVCCVFCFLVLLAAACPNAIARCDQASQTAGVVTPNEVGSSTKELQAQKLKDRTVLLELQLSSGSVRAVEVLRGITALRAPAIRAAARRTYKARPGYNPTLTAVEVRFTEGKYQSPRVRQITFGVSSCVIGGTPVMPLAWLGHLLSGKSIVPVINSAPEN